MGQELEQLIDRLGGTLGVHRDRPVGFVAHPSPEAQRQRPAPGLGTEADALDRAADRAP